MNIMKLEDLRFILNTALNLEKLSISMDPERSELDDDEVETDSHSLAVLEFTLTKCSSLNFFAYVSYQEDINNDLVIQALIRGLKATKDYKRNRLKFELRFSFEDSTNVLSPLRILRVNQLIAVLMESDIADFMVVLKTNSEWESEIWGSDYDYDAPRLSDALMKELQEEDNHVHIELFRADNSRGGLDDDRVIIKNKGCRICGFEESWLMK